VPILTVILGVLAALSFFADAIGVKGGDVVLFSLGLGFWAAAWTASKRGA
jgi:hypothetical protein